MTGNAGPERMAIPSWGLPAVGYILVTGALGIVSKFALRSLTWIDILAWSGLVYGSVAIFLLLSRRATVSLGVPGALAGLCGVLAAAGLVFLFVALERGDVSRVVPATSIYPLLTVMLAVVFLDEELTLLKAVGTLLVIVGVVALTR